MNSQNIKKFYGSKLDLKLDSSEFYDFELSNDTNYNNDVLDLTNEITYTGLTIDSSCYSGFTNLWVLPINELYTEYDCDFKIRKRTEKGWTLDFVFNRNNIGMPQLRQNSCLVKKTFEAPCESFLILNVPSSMNCEGTVAGRKFSWKILFDSNLLHQVHITRKIGYAETSLTKNFFYLELMELKIIWQ